MYLYLMMLCDEVGSCHPTIDQIRADLGLLSATMVFESISVLEEYGFFVRNRQSFPEARSKRNAYQRTTCEYPVLRLLQIGRIDGNLHASESPVAPASDEAKRLTEEGLHKLLEGEYHRYSLASNDQKKDILIEVLSQTLAERSRGIYL